MISELKLVEDEWEIAQLQDAVDATVRGFEDVARVVPADRGVSERLIEGGFGLRARHDDNDVGYGSIVGAGPHATILCWKRNDGLTAHGGLLLMDMGVENRHLYTADVTRTLDQCGLNRVAPFHEAIRRIAPFERGGPSRYPPRTRRSVRSAAVRRRGG
ncbi:M24 family metallopeptidase [Nonomuraea sp. NPDC049158]|uniref:M24 family metallopeptidase n=1 Tax=Nonomuraea sp. NPDC049158 TaxID=3155649 RepID=UPI0033E221F9